MKELTFFAKRRSFHRDDGHLLRGTSMIRGDQISEYMGAKLNPQSGFEDDVCIYVKPNTKELYAGDIKLAKNAYIDIIDGHNLEMYLDKNPHIPTIACSQYDYGHLKEILKNPIILIPQHTCNIERIRRTRTEVVNVGIVGSRQTVEMIPPELIERLREMGLNFVSFKSFKTREHVVEFYKTMDLQVIWRPNRVRLSNPLKILNAASFGIPTVCLREKAYDEVKDICIGVGHLDGLIESVAQLVKNPELYAEYARKCIEKSEEYHISKIAELYRNLCVQS